MAPACQSACPSSGEDLHRRAPALPLCIGTAHVMPPQAVIVSQFARGQRVTLEDPFEAAVGGYHMFDLFATGPLRFRWLAANLWTSRSPERRKPKKSKPEYLDV